MVSGKECRLLMAEKFWLKEGPKAEKNLQFLMKFVENKLFEIY